MRILLFLSLLYMALFSVELTPAQLAIAQSAGYTENDIDKALSKEKAQTQEKKEQIISNSINDEKSSKKSFIKNDMEKEALKRYASKFFNNKNNINPYSLPTPKNYVLNYSDKLSLTIFGGQNEEFNLIINKDGNVTIPQVGELNLIGMSFYEAKKLIIEETKKAYPNSTNILVNISEFTAIQVTVSGLVNAPGLYNLSSFSTIKDALINSGGILNSGSYRNISLKRNNKIIKTFDLYNLVRYGNNSSDMVLKSGDVIIVNPVKIEIRLEGQIKNPAIYELNNRESFKSLFNFASGLQAKANKNAIKLKRYINNSIKVYTLSLSQLYSMKPKNGDEIQVFKLSEQNANLVKISGNVLISGEKELPSDKKLSTLLNNELKIFGKSGFFKADTNYDYALIKNLDTVKNFNLKNVLARQNDLNLKSGDEIIILNKYSLKEKPYIFANGDIVSEDSKKVEYYKGLKSKNLFDIVKFKTEKDENAYYVDKSKVQVNRLENNKRITILVNILENPEFEIKAYDEIQFFDFYKTNEIKKASIKGEVFISGTYNITGNTTINDLVKIAGGLTKKTLMSNCEVARYEVVGNERVRTILNFDLKEAIKSNERVFEDDEWSIFAIQNWNEKRYIELKGEVVHPGKYSIAKGEKLSNVLKRAGGFTNNAFIEGSVFTREEVRLLQVKRLEESLDRLKNKAIQASASANEAGEDNQTKQNMINAVNQLEKEAESNKPIGRISLDLYLDTKRFESSPHNLTLKDKDVLYIPGINDTISIVGEVLNQNTFIYDSKYDALNYIEKAGGITGQADEDFIYIVKANGEAKRLENNYFWANSNEVFKGDTIVVPLNVDPISDIGFAKDITQIVYQLAITAASIHTVGGL